MPTQEWQIGDIILNQYEVRARLGEGAMGTVYKVYLRVQKRDMAVKSPKLEIFSREGGMEKFIREAETWVRLGSYPYIVECYFVLNLGGIPRIFAELLEGGNLTSWIRTRKLYEGGHETALKRMLSVAIQFAWGLHFAHEQGLIHRDVKPANVMMTPLGIAKVTDFGLAKARTMAGEKRISGTERNILVSGGGMTPAYCSPEQAANQPLSHKTDIWSWGVSVLEMFVGRVTWQAGPLAQQALASQRRQDMVIPPMPPEIGRLLSRCFQPRPEDRPATLLSIADELQDICMRLTGQMYPLKLPKTAERRADTLCNQAYSLFELGLLGREEVMAAYEQALQLDPTSAEIPQAKALLLAQLGRLEEALMAYEQALQLDPTYVEAHFCKGLVLLKLGRMDEVLPSFEKALQFDPTHVEAHYFKGVELIKRGQLKEGLAAFEQVLHLNPTHADAHYFKGVVLGTWGWSDEALAAFEQALRLNPTHVDAHHLKGYVLEKLGRREEAEQAYRKERELRGRG